MDAVSIDTVIAREADCSDRARAEAALSKALAAARGPKRSKEAASADQRWRLDMQVVTSAPGIKSADAQIRDDTGRVVAERTVSDRAASGACTALARAVGAWAQIVLDDELVRAHEDAEKATKPEPEPPESRPIVMTTSRPRKRSGTDTEADDITPKPETEQTVRTFEIGTTLFLRNGVAATGGIFGASPFITIGFSKIWVLRPAFLVGTSTSKVPPDQSKSDNVSAVGGRFDFCRRLPGNYLDRRGVEVDACAGGDVMHISSDLSSAWRASLGPSAIVRGELGNFGLEFRGVVGANLLRGGFVGGDAPYFVAGAELGGSVRFR